MRRLVVTLLALALFLLGCGSDAIDRAEELFANSPPRDCPQGEGEVWGEDCIEAVDAGIVVDVAPAARPQIVNVPPAAPSALAVGVVGAPRTTPGTGGAP